MRRISHRETREIWDGKEKKRRKESSGQIQYQHKITTIFRSVCFILETVAAGFNHFLLYCCIKQKEEMPKAKNRKLETC